MGYPGYRVVLKSHQPRWSYHDVMPSSHHALGHRCGNNILLTPIYKHNTLSIIFLREVEITIVPIATNHNVDALMPNLPF